jgi:hypothetical protein
MPATFAGSVAPLIRSADAALEGVASASTNKPAANARPVVMIFAKDTLFAKNLTSKTVIGFCMMRMIETPCAATV